MLGPLFKLRVLAKQVSQDFMHSFLGLMPQGTCPFQHRAAPMAGIVSGLRHCFRLQAGRGSKSAERLGDFLQTE